MINKQDLLVETYNNFKFLKELKSGLLVYNKSHFKNTLINITSDIKEIKDRIKDGWSIYPGRYKFILQAPETVLCDLSDIYLNPTSNIIEILTFFKFLKSVNIRKFLNQLTLNSYFKNLEIILLDGIFSDIQVRIGGSDKRVYNIPRYLYKIFKKTNLWQVKLKESRNILNIRKFNIINKKITQAKIKTKKYYHSLIKNYSIFNKINIPTELVYGFWKNLPSSDVYIFVPKSGLKYAFGFINEKGNVDKVMLWECHLGLDQYKELKFFSKILKNKKVAIIDISYSGNTLDYIRKKVLQEGGEPTTIALFPKSKRAIKRSDYILFLDRFILSKNISFKKNWQEDLFIKVVNNEFFGD